MGQLPMSAWSSEPDRPVYHRWFAWYPVRALDVCGFRWVWLRTVLTLQDYSTDWRTLYVTRERYAVKRLTQ